MITAVNGLTATDKYKRQMNELMLEVFGFSFAKWHAMGMWNEDYTSYAILGDDRILANVSVFRMKLLVHGKEQEWLQIGAVATREEERNKGYGRKLMEHVLGLYPQGRFMLCANGNATGFYPKFGFRSVVYKQAYLSHEQPADGKMMRKLTVSDPEVDAYLWGRSQFSAVLDCMNGYATNWFHLLSGLGDYLWEIPELEVMVVAEQAEEELLLHDVIARRPLTFTELKPYLQFPGVQTIRFGFNPDWLGLDAPRRDYESEDEFFMIRGAWEPEEPNFILPQLILT
jgi:predicted GNAT family N-acyltransferase